MSPELKKKLLCSDCWWTLVYIFCAFREKSAVLLAKGIAYLIWPLWKWTPESRWCFEYYPLDRILAYQKLREARGRTARSSSLKALTGAL